METHLTSKHYDWFRKKCRNCVLHGYKYDKWDQLLDMALYIAAPDDIVNMVIDHAKYLSGYVFSYNAQYDIYSDTTIRKMIKVTTYIAITQYMDERVIKIILEERNICHELIVCERYPLPSCEYIPQPTDNNRVKLIGTMHNLKLTNDSLIANLIEKNDDLTMYKSFYELREFFCLFTKRLCTEEFSKLHSSNA